MDPEATLRLAADAVSAGDVDQAFQHMIAYASWLCRGGFETPELAAEFDRVQVLIETACDKLAEFHFADLHD